MEIEKLKKRQRFEAKSMYIIEYVYRIWIIQHFLPFLAKTGIHPIAVTAINTVLFPFVLWFIYEQYFVLAALLVQLYAIIDHADGMLARYTNKQTYIGSRLDRFNDNIFFNAIFIVIALTLDLPYWMPLLAIISLNIHNFLGMFYFQNRMRKLSRIRRFGLKKWFLERNFLLGIDCSLLLSSISFFMLIGQFELLFYVVSFLYLFDAFYRFIELKINERLQKKEQN